MVARRTVPVPIPSDLATFKIPTPFANCGRARQFSHASRRGMRCIASPPPSHTKVICPSVRFDCARKAYKLGSQRRGRELYCDEIEVQKTRTKLVNLTVERRYLTEREIDRLMDCARKHGRCGHRDATMILVAYRQVYGPRRCATCNGSRSSCPRVALDRKHRLGRHRSRLVEHAKEIAEHTKRWAEILADFVASARKLRHKLNRERARAARR